MWSLAGQSNVDFQILFATVAEEDEAGFGKRVQNFDYRRSFSFSGRLHEAAQQRASTVVFQLLDSARYVSTINLTFREYIVGNRCSDMKSRIDVYNSKGELD